MEFIKYIIIAIVQGISEVLPISSSAHLVLAQDLLGMNDSNLTFEVFLHLASLVAVLFYLRKRIYALIKGFILYVFKRQNEYQVEFKYCLCMIISTIPVVIIALLLGDYVEIIGSTIWAVGLLLIVNGLLLTFITRLAGFKGPEEFGYIDALTIGLFQCIGVLPGISRSGSCLYGGYLRKVEKETAADYAFLLFIPSVLGATVLEAKNFSSIILDEKIWMYAIAFLITAIVTYFAFNILLKVIRKGKLNYFGYYCVLAGIASVIYGLLK